ncbi:MAG: TA system VapC family ribonuclease toxin [Verrucomicrobiales bacterium]
MATRCLLDINVLIALMDPDHAFHHRAHDWWGGKARPWASCPLTENGLLRIMASSGYSKTICFSVAEIQARLAMFVANSDHDFWTDSISIRDARHFQQSAILTSKQLTYVYLLALAVENHGCLVTFDRHIPLVAVRSASATHLEVI